MKRKTKSNSIESVVFLRGKKITLRPCSENDIPDLMKWVNDPEIRKYIIRTTPANEKNERDWLEKIHANEKTLVALIIQVNDVSIGNISLRMNWVERIGTVGILIGEKGYQGKGLGIDASMTIIEYAFNTLNLRKIEWMTKAFNERSIACAQSCGFKIEGRMRDEFFSGGRYWDQVILGMFRSEWIPYWEKYQKGGATKK